MLEGLNDESPLDGIAGSRTSISTMASQDSYILDAFPLSKSDLALSVAPSDDVSPSSPRREADSSFLAAPLAYQGGHKSHDRSPSETSVATVRAMDQPLVTTPVPSRAVKTIQEPLGQPPVLHSATISRTHFRQPSCPVTPPQSSSSAQDDDAFDWGVETPDRQTTRLIDRLHTADSATPDYHKGRHSASQSWDASTAVQRVQSAPVSLDSPLQQKRADRPDMSIQELTEGHRGAQVGVYRGGHVDRAERPRERSTDMTAPDAQIIATQMPQTPNRYEFWPQMDYTPKPSAAAPIEPPIVGANDSRRTGSANSFEFDTQDWTPERHLQAGTQALLVGADPWLAVRHWSASRCPIGRMLCEIAVYENWVSAFPGCENQNCLDGVTAADIRALVPQLTSRIASSLFSMGMLRLGGAGDELFALRAYELTGQLGSRDGILAAASMYMRGGKRFRKDTVRAGQLFRQAGAKAF